MYNSVDERVFLARKYTNELGWWLVPVRGSGPKPKAPIPDGWTDVRTPIEGLTEILEMNSSAGIGVHLGGSGLIDLEGDSIEGEAILDELCRGLEFPCWRSTRGTHRLFQAHPDIQYHKIETLGIEFRAGRHQSVLPPTVFRGSLAKYEWSISPFDQSPPPLADHIRQFYLEHGGGKVSQRRTAAPSAKTPRFTYRDNFDYLFRHFDLMAEVEEAGLELLCHHPDDNGNVPCFVPAILRDGKEDRHPSGVFNVFNGTLRDFATGKNHQYFQRSA